MVKVCTIFREYGLISKIHANFCVGGWYFSLAVSSELEEGNTSSRKLRVAACTALKSYQPEEGVLGMYSEYSMEQMRQGSIDYGLF